MAVPTRSVVASIVLLATSALATPGLRAARRAMTKLAPEDIEHPTSASLRVHGFRAHLGTRKKARGMESNKLGIGTEKGGTEITYKAPGGGYSQARNLDDMFPSEYGPRGEACVVCGVPLSEESPGQSGRDRGYTGGKAVNSSSIEKSQWPDGQVFNIAPDYIVRDDCGYGADEDFIYTPLSNYSWKYTGAMADVYPGFMNGWCYFNVENVDGNAFVNRDPLFLGKSIDFLYGPPLNPEPVKCEDTGACLFDYEYCKANGFLSVEARQAVADGFDASVTYARSVCQTRASEGYDIRALTGLDLMIAEDTGKARDSGKPTDDESKLIGAWLCAMGDHEGKSGADSAGPMADIAYCAYTFGDLDPDFPGEFCMLDECDGFDLKTGQLVQQYHQATSALGHTGTDDLKPPKNQTISRAPPNTGADDEGSGAGSGANDLGRA